MLCIKNNNTTTYIIKNVAFSKSKQLYSKNNYIHHVAKLGLDATSKCTQQKYLMTNAKNISTTNYNPVNVDYKNNYIEYNIEYVVFFKKANKAASYITYNNTTSE